MKTSLRLTAVVAALTLGSTAVLVAAPAQAADPAAHYQAVALTQFSADTGATPDDCTLTSTGAESTGEQTITTSGTQKISLSKASSATATHNSDAADTTTMSGKATLTGTVVAKGGALTSLALKGTMSASSKAALGIQSDCDGQAGAGQGIQIEFTVVKAGWLKLTVANSRGVQNQVILSRMGGGAVQFGGIGSKASHVVKRKVAPGAYQLQVQTQLVNGNVIGGAPYAVSATSSVGLVYSAKKP